jgi:hypothetical protein
VSASYDSPIPDSTTSQENPTTTVGGNGVPDADSLALHADSLADWVARHMVVRQNAYGYYTEKGERRTAKENLQRATLTGHFEGKGTIGLFPISTDNCSKWGTIDIDFHDPSKDDADANWACALRSVELFGTYGLTAYIFESDGLGGYHARFFLKNSGPGAPRAHVPSRAVYWVCQRVVAALRQEFPGICLEAFPKQPYLTEARLFGNWIRLFGQHPRTGCWARVWDPARGEMLAGADFAEYVTAIEGDDPAPLLAAYEADLTANPPAELPARDYEDDGEKPSIDEVRSALDALDDSKASDYDDWLQVGMALHGWDHFDGLDLWKEFSARDPDKYDGTGAECQSKWNGFSSGGSDSITIRSLFRWAYDAGWTEFRPPSPPKKAPIIIVGDDGWPALRLGKLPPVPEFPLEVLPPVVQELVIAAAEAAGGVDPGMVAAPLLVVGAGMIGRSASLRYKDNYFYSACLYHANVAVSGLGKSPVTRCVAAPLAIIEEQLHAYNAVLKENYRISMRQYEADKRNKVPGIQEPTRPLLRQLEVDDITVEGIVRTDSENPRGILMVQHELSGLMRSFGQYKGGKGNDREYFSKIYDGERIKKNRSGYENNEPLYVPHPFMPITGNMPPTLLPSLFLRDIHDGLPERFTYVFPDPRRRLRSDERGQVPNALLARWVEICERLFALEMVGGGQGQRAVPHVLHFSAGGKDTFDTILDSHVDEYNDEDYPDYLKSVYPKMEDRAGRFSLNLALLWHAADPKADMNRLPEVEEADAISAWRLIDYHTPHHCRVMDYLEGFGLGHAPRYAQLVLNWIKNHRGITSFSSRDLTKVYSTPKGYEPALLEDALIWLASKHAIRLQTKGQDGEKKKTGRPASAVFDISPQLREMQASSLNPNEDDPQ